ncbi:MAG: YbaK/EbsC family protein [Actinomycetes bacterium]
MPLDHPTVQRLTQLLRTLGVSGQVVALPEAAPTAAAAAAQLGCEVDAIANSLVFDADGDPLLVLASGGHRVDVHQLTEHVGAQQVRKASAPFVREHTGMPIGGVAPVGHPTAIRTIVDVTLERYPVVWAAAGHPYTVFPTSYAELVRITGGSPAQVAAGPT